MCFGPDTVMEENKDEEDDNNIPDWMWQLAQENIVLSPKPIHFGH
jgi:hypothetical protein